MTTEVNRGRRDGKKAEEDVGEKRRTLTTMASLMYGTYLY
jgi:hypothetical protein